ncbi:hypothetical protein T261_05650 [Streptomyces lydicus]|nr:hypothetical protein T261_05650 [Streptomyces lydicus]
MTDATNGEFTAPNIRGRGDRRRRRAAENRADRITGTRR